jgi:hypothetical protein
MAGTSSVLTALALAACAGAADVRYVVAHRLSLMVTLPA